MGNDHPVEDAAILHLDTREEDSVPVCAVRGELDASNVDVALARILEAVPGDAPGVAVDLTDTTYVDSAGVRVFFELARRLRERRQQLRMVVPPEGIVRRVLLLTALGDVVPFDDTLGDAVGAVRSRG
jgi:anti-anti-sigma factor